MLAKQGYKDMMIVGNVSLVTITPVILVVEILLYILSRRRNKANDSLLPPLYKRIPELIVIICCLISSIVSILVAVYEYDLSTMIPYLAAGMGVVYLLVMPAFCWLLKKYRTANNAIAGILAFVLVPTTFFGTGQFFFNIERKSFVLFLFLIWFVMAFAAIFTTLIACYNKRFFK